MSDTLRFTPKQVDIYGMMGDSVSFNVHITEWDQLVSPVITAQVRDLDGNNPQDFTVTPIADGGACYLIPSQTRALGELESGRGKVVVSSNQRQMWRGRYDVQLSHETSMARTVLAGGFFLEKDVTQ